jgi:hypothetical protein
VSFNGGFLEYTQLGGLIGPRQRRALSARIDTRLPNGKLSGSVTIDSDAWDFSIDKITSISSVNGEAGFFYKQARDYCRSLQGRCDKL